jgi:hypothetical protein
MTTNYLEHKGGHAERKQVGWELLWPDGFHMPAVFTTIDAERLPGATRLTLDEPRVRSIIKQLPRFAPTQPIPCLELKTLSKGIRGTWSLWTVSIGNSDGNQDRVLTVFLHDDGRVLSPSARRIWDALLEERPDPVRFLGTAESTSVTSGLWAAAERQGQPLYTELSHFQERRFGREIDKKRFALESRRKMIEQISLRAVREHRLNELTKEESEWKRDVQFQSAAQPELIPRVILRVEGVLD